DQLYSRLDPGLPRLDELVDFRTVVGDPIRRVADKLGTTAQDDPVLLEIGDNLRIFADEIAMLAGHVHVMDFLNSPSIDLACPLNQFEKLSRALAAADV